MLPRKNKRNNARIKPERKKKSQGERDSINENDIGRKDRFTEEENK